MNSSLNFINAYVRLGYDITEKLAISFDIDIDIDLVGLTFGSVESTLLLGEGESSRNDNVTATPVTGASPTTINYLIMGDLDNGSLNSTLGLTYNLTKKFAIDAGFGLVFTEVTSDIAVGYDGNDRFRNKNMLGYLVVSYGFGK